jgi:type II secretory ATPase GspE/PulE/Tfp pilus assembly ATPase PilB-like protein
MVLSTLHTNSAAETITRLLELGVDAFNFADAFLGVLAQRLVRTICPDCGRKRAPSVEELESLQKMYGNGFRDMLNDLPRAPEVRDPVGCDRCSGTGYRGRTAVHELITTSPQFRRLILDGKDAESLREQALIQGTETLLQDGIQKILQGDIDILQLRRVVLPKGF